MTSSAFVCVVLAAGEGSRAGGFKPLFHFDKETRFVDRIIQAAQVVCCEVRVVGGAHVEKLQEHLERHHPAVTLIRNSDWKNGGMFSSVQKGLEGTVCPCFVHPADIPGPSDDVYRALADIWKICKADVLRPTYKGVSGHPILLSPPTANDIVRAVQTAVLRDILRKKRRVDVPVSDKTILKDYDTVQDLKTISIKISQ